MRKTARREYRIRQFVGLPIITGLSIVFGLFAAKQFNLADNATALMDFRVLNGLLGLGGAALALLFGLLAVQIFWKCVLPFGPFVHIQKKDIKPLEVSNRRFVPTAPLAG